ncbi:MAG TPA: hypothetical protein VK707_09745 [Solirubrobacteraceae bacterium]|jgi:hypothetical protein|nr:hypothetical protein [Solirubrobacteraceae bacterium]
MSDEPSRPPSAGVGVGLCDTCTHRQEVRNTRGSVFSLCTLSRVDPAYPRYPRLPVISCDGYERREHD